MNAQPAVMELSVPGNIKLVSVLGEMAELFVKKIVTNGNEAKDLAFKINLALTEASSNAIFHGCKNKMQDQIKIKIEVENNIIIIEVTDKGGGLKISEIEQPDPFEERGRGLYIIKQFMDSVEYHRSDGEYKFIMKKELTPHTQAFNHKE